MVVRYEVGKYSLLMLTDPSRPTLIGYIYLYNPSGNYLGLVAIMQNGTVLPANAQYSNGLLAIYFHEAEMESMLDTLRNEKPIYVQFHTSLKWGSLGTDLEPVGEQEVPRAA